MKGAKTKGGVKLAPGLSMRGVILSLSPLPPTCTLVWCRVNNRTSGCYDLFKFCVLKVSEGDTVFCEIYNIRYKIYTRVLISP